MRDVFYERPLYTYTLYVYAGDRPASGLRRAAAVGAGGAAAARGPAALGAGHTAVPDSAVQSAAAARNVPRPVPQLHTAHEHTGLRERDTDTN